MSIDNNFLVVHFGGQVEMWSVKPPLMIWLQVLFIKFIGVNEIAIRA
jgi:4-amino-4-deoxy-L-arabinose transferase-like glycosyltransferase